MSIALETPATPARSAAERTRERWTKCVLLALLALLIVRWIDIRFFGQWEVRLDSGDLRRSGCVFASLPDRLQADTRSRIMDASRELAIQPEWHRALPSAPSNSDVGNRNHLYTHAACWLEEEPELGKIILAQITEYILHPGDESGKHPALGFLWYVRFNWDRRRYEINTSRLDEDGGLLQQLAEIGYTPRPGGVLDRSAQQHARELDGYAHVLVDSITSQGGSKYQWQHARVVKVIQCDARWVIGAEIDFAHVNTMSDVPDRPTILYLEHFDGPPEWWRLFKYE